MEKNSVPICPKDGFPKVKIKGRWECVAEYIDRCVGGKHVDDMVQRGQTAFYVFKDGHEIPLLCSCCGEPLVVDDFEHNRQDIIGRQLHSMEVVPAELENGKQALELHLLFLKTEQPPSGICEIVSTRVAAQMKHPPDCPHREGSSTSRRSTKRRRKRRRQ